LATIFLARRWTVVFTIANVALIALLPLYAPSGLLSSEDIRIHITINVLLGSVAIVSTTHREVIEKDRRESNRRSAAAALASLNHALEVRHQESAGHSNRAVELTIELAKRCGITNQSHLQRIREGALLHDIGKIAVPDGILLKNGPLTDEEWIVVKTHPTVGYELMKEFEFFRDSLAIPLYHHERYDGSGYPEGLAGDEIPLEARIFAIVDVYDAMLEERPYRDALPIEEVMEHFDQFKGVLYDPVVLNEFLEMIN
jgi:HD-GYP domain-containing protein (c-di-GMP phosphodiesterase class II)